MTEDQIKQCLDYADSIIADRVKRAIPRCGSDIYARTLGEFFSYWLEDPPEDPEKKEEQFIIDFYGYFDARRYGNIQYANINESWDDSTRSDDVRLFSVLFYPNGDSVFFWNLFSQMATIYQNYDSPGPPPVTGFNKQDKSCTFRPQNLPFPVRVVFNQSTTINGVTTIEEINVDFTSSQPQTLDASLQVFGERITSLLRVERLT